MVDDALMVDQGVFIQISRKEVEEMKVLSEDGPHFVTTTTCNIKNWPGIG